MINLKKSLSGNRLSVGSWITIGNASVAEIMAGAGFDWLTIDMEHSGITLSEAQMLMQVIDSRGNGVPCLVRVGENDPALIKRVMDIGAHGVIVPMVNTREDAIKAVEAVRYPPRGKRGVGLARAQGYGLKFEAYKKWLRDDGVVIAQIEHIEGVENLEEILSVDGIDAFFVGPYDLSASLGHPGEFDRREVKDALKRIKDVSRSMGSTAGFHVVQPDTGAMREKIREGYRFLAFSFDALLFSTICRESLTKINVFAKRSR